MRPASVLQCALALSSVLLPTTAAEAHEASQVSFNSPSSASEDLLTSSQCSRTYSILHRLIDLSGSDSKEWLSPPTSPFTPRGRLHVDGNVGTFEVHPVDQKLIDLDWSQQQELKGEDQWDDLWYQVAIAREDGEANEFTPESSIRAVSWSLPLHFPRLSRYSSPLAGKFLSLLFAIFVPRALIPNPQSLSMLYLSLSLFFSFSLYTLQCHLLSSDKDVITLSYTSTFSDPISVHISTSPSSGDSKCPASVAYSKLEDLLESTRLGVDRQVDVVVQLPEVLKR